jgi:hypothetical protein
VARKVNFVAPSSSSVARAPRSACMHLIPRDATEHDMKGRHRRKRVSLHPEELVDEEDSWAAPKVPW